MPKAKATKKFEKKHLKDVLKRRNESAKVKQKHKQWAKKKTEKKYEDGGDSKAGAPGLARRKPVGLADEKFAGMATDKFFEDRVDVPELDKKLKKKVEAAKKRQQEREDESVDEDDESESGSESDAEGAEAAEDSEEESDSDSEEENVPAGSDSEADSDAESLPDVDKHKDQLSALKEKDPEFFKYLQENDPEMLNFEGGDGLSLSDSEADDADDKGGAGSGSDSGSDSDSDGAGNGEADSDEDGEPKGRDGGKRSRTLNVATVEKWKKELEEQKSLRVLREVAVAFRAAANVNLGDGGKTEKVYRYSITNPDVYHQLLLVALKDIPKVLQHHIPLTESKNGKVRFDNNSKHFRSLVSILKSHLSALQKLLASLSDDSSVRLTLESLSAVLPYTLSFKKGIKDVIGTVTDVWSSPGNSEPVRVSAFLVLHRLTTIADAGTRDTVLKTVYQGLVKGSRNTTVYTIEGINLMKNSAAQLWGIDPAVGYTTAFGFIRQLAIHLRTSITKNGQDGYKAVYNWQYLHSLDFWSRVVSAQCNRAAEAAAAGAGAGAGAGAESPLRPLIYPIVQVTLGAIRLIPTAQYFPLRFHLVRSLIRISGATGTYVPLGPALFEALDSAEMRKRARASTAKPVEFETALRAPTALLGTRVYQDGVGAEVAELLAEAFALWATHVSFPELALPVVVMVKRWLRDVSAPPRKKHDGRAGAGGGGGNGNGKVNHQIGLVVQKIEANARWIEAARAKVEFGPDNRAGVERLAKELEWAQSPVGSFVAAQRVVRAERRKMVAEGRREEKRKRDRERVGRGDGDEEDEDEEDGKSGKGRKGKKARTGPKKSVPDGAFEAGSESDDDDDSDA